MLKLYQKCMHAGDNTRPTRPRSQTSPFDLLRFGASRNRQEPTPAQPELTLYQLLDALNPGSVPSLLQARALPAALQSTDRALPPEVVIPVIGSLCSQSVVKLQIPGFDALAEYCATSQSLQIADRVALVSLFRPASYNRELWPSQRKALSQIIKVDIIGIEDPVILEILPVWMQGILEDANYERVQICKEDVTEAFKLAELVGRFTDNHQRHWADVLSSMVRGKLRSRHQRHASSSSALAAQRNPLDLALQLYLGLSSLFMTPIHLPQIVPLLCQVYSRKIFSAAHGVDPELESLFGSPGKSYSALQQLRSALTSESAEVASGAFCILGVLLHNQLKLRILRNKWQRDAADYQTATGAPSIELDPKLPAILWPREESPFTIKECLGQNFGNACKHWVESEEHDREKVLEKALGLIQGIIGAIDEAQDESVWDIEDSQNIGAALSTLAQSIPHHHESSHSVPSNTLRALNLLLTSDSPVLSQELPRIRLAILNRLPDSIAADTVQCLAKQQELGPISDSWIGTWSSLLGGCSGIGFETQRALAENLLRIHDSLKEQPAFRRPFLIVIFEFLRDRDAGGNESLSAMDIHEACLSILGEEVVLRLQESHDGADLDVDVDDLCCDITDFLIRLAGKQDSSELNQVPQPTSSGSPAFSRMSSEVSTPRTDKFFNSSFFAKIPTTSSANPGGIHLPSDSRSSFLSSSKSTAAMATVTLATIFQACLDLSSDICTLLFDKFVSISGQAKSPAARVIALQLLMRLRADRNHHIYLLAGADEVNVVRLAGYIGRGIVEERVARSRAPERDTRRASRGRGQTTSSRSRSRIMEGNNVVAQRFQGHVPPLWNIPEVFPFSIDADSTSSQSVVSYGSRGELMISDYIETLQEILESEHDWEVFSYVLVHLPAQLANKHLFCGPLARKAINSLIWALCTNLSQLGSQVDPWPPNVKLISARGLAYQTLSVLISYGQFMEPNLQQTLVDRFLTGLGAEPDATQCCINALSLAAYEMPRAMTRTLPQIIEKLIQIMSHAAMMVHILDFLAIVGSQPALYANFTQADFRTVFTVALKYLEHHNREREGADALSQHVRIMSFFIVYVWFLAVRLPDRPAHVKHIARRLQYGKEGRDELDGPTEVCFDWLARYTYASADPRPSHSTLSDIILDPPGDQNESISEKTWLLGYSVVTIRALARRGWIEVQSRRPSGLTKFLCKLENVPMVNVGDVDPDMTSIEASLMMNRNESQSDDNMDSSATPRQTVRTLFADASSTVQTDAPDPVHGYVWSGVAPSQRRKNVDLDPSFFALQLSPYPDVKWHPTRGRIVTDQALLSKFIRNLDRLPVIDTHSVGILYVAPGQQDEVEILRNTHGSPAYTRFLEGLGRLLRLRGQQDVYTGGLDPDVDGEYAYAWWDDIGQILYHTATLMPNNTGDERANFKKRHIGNDFVRIVWNDSGVPYRFDTLTTQFQFINIVIEPHSRGTSAAFSDNAHENEYFRISMQRAFGMAEFGPIGDFKIISALSLPRLIRQISLLADWYASIWAHTQSDTSQEEKKTNWRHRLEAIKQFSQRVSSSDPQSSQRDGPCNDLESIPRDFSALF